MQLVPAKILRNVSRAFLGDSIFDTWSKFSAVDILCVMCIFTSKRFIEMCIVFVPCFASCVFPRVNFGSGKVGLGLASCTNSELTQDMG